MEKPRAALLHHIGWPMVVSRIQSASVRLYHFAILYHLPGILATTTIISIIPPFHAAIRLWHAFDESGQSHFPSQHLHADDLGVAAPTLQSCTNAPLFPLWTHGRPHYPWTGMGVPK